MKNSINNFRPIETLFKPENTLFKKGQYIFMETPKKDRLLVCEKDFDMSEIATVCNQKYPEFLNRTHKRTLPNRRKNNLKQEFYAQVLLDMGFVKDVEFFYNLPKITTEYDNNSVIRKLAEQSINNILDKLK